MKAFVLAGTQSGVGKTSISIALMKVLTKKYDVAAFKVGPDYIDPSFHSWVTGNPSYNLDYFLMGSEGVHYSFETHQRECNIIEGVMGLYDGLGHGLDNASTAHVARLLELPVILVVDTGGKSTSIAAQILGYQTFDPRVKIAGIILNKVTSEKSYLHYKEAIEQYNHIPCLGYLLKAEEVAISSRHLGLLQAEEVKNLEKKVEKLAEMLEESIDFSLFEKMIELPNREKKQKHPLRQYKNQWQGKKIGIAKDEAFRFYYQDNLEVLAFLGMDLHYFSPIHDKIIPQDIDILYFGGGYPENYAKELAQNTSMIESIQNFSGKIYGECGGFMYLGKELQCLSKESYQFCNLLPASTEMKNRLNIKRFGYVSIREGDREIARAHEFHYSDILEIEEDSRIYVAQKMDGRNWKCIFKNGKNIVGGYPHIHFFKAGKYLERIFGGGKG